MSRSTIMLAARNKLRALLAGELTTAHDADRIANMLLMRSQGATLAEISREIGVTGEAVRQALQQTTTRRARTRNRGYLYPRCACRQYNAAYARKIGHVC